MENTTNNPLSAPWRIDYQTRTDAWIKDNDNNYVAKTFLKQGNRIILIPDLAQSLIDTIEGFEQILKETNNPNSVDDFTFVKRAKEVLNKLG